MILKKIEGEITKERIKKELEIHTGTNLMKKAITVMIQKIKAGQKDLQKKTKKKKNIKNIVHRKHRKRMFLKRLISI